MDRNNIKSLYLGFGSNLGDSGHLVTRAIKAFVNAIAKYHSDLDPFEILDFTSELETRFFRQRDPRRPKGPRTLDIDIIFYGDLILQTDKLTIPHARFKERKFILFPMSEIDVNYQVPGTSLNIADYILRCPDKSKVEKI